jgi:hypothetical protein
VTADEMQAMQRTRRRWMRALAWLSGPRALVYALPLAAMSLWNVGWGHDVAVAFTLAALWFAWSGLIVLARRRLRRLTQRVFNEIIDQEDEHGV